MLKQVQHLFLHAMTPRKISVKDKKFLYILWDNGEESKIILSNLRKNCPCANCMVDRQRRPSSYIPLLSGIQTTLKDIKIIGNYALQLIWQDGHDLGIYSFEVLKKLSSKE